MTAAVVSPHAAQFMRRALAPEIPESLRALFAGIPRDPSYALRNAAWKAFENLGLPRNGDEDYSFTSVTDLNALLSQAVKPRTVAAGGTEFPDWIAYAAGENDAPAALAMAFAPHPLALNIPAGSKAAEPIRLQNENPCAAWFFELGAGSSSKMRLNGADFQNGIAIFKLGPGAELDFAHEPGDQTQALKLHFILENNSKLRFASASTGSAFQRLAIEADLMGSGSDLELRGAAVVGGNRRCHRHIRMRHHAPGCKSRQLFKTVVLGSGRSSVDGTVTVDRGAQKTDARQVIRHLMLSKEGRADAKPRLLIHADDVQCGHGATVGRPDPEQQFYLRSRGLDAADSNRLLTRAFLAEALEGNGTFDREMLGRLLETLPLSMPLSMERGPGGEA